MMVKEIFVTKGKVVKSIRIMGRGRAGIARRKWSHLNLTLREIDFDALIEGAEKRSQREKLIARKKQVGLDWRESIVSLLKSAERVTRPHRFHRFMCRCTCLLFVPLMKSVCLFFLPSVLVFVCVCKRELFLFVSPVVSSPDTTHLSLTLTLLYLCGLCF